MPAASYLESDYLPIPTSLPTLPNNIHTLTNQLHPCLLALPWQLLHFPHIVDLLLNTHALPCEQHPARNGLPRMLNGGSSGNEDPTFSGRVVCMLRTRSQQLAVASLS
jgi:hypothetical protein